MGKKIKGKDEGFVISGRWQLLQIKQQLWRGKEAKSKRECLETEASHCCKDAQINDISIPCNDEKAKSYQWLASGLKLLLSMYSTGSNEKQRINVLVNMATFLAKILWKACLSSLYLLAL